MRVYCWHLQFCLVYPHKFIQVCAPLSHKTNNNRRQTSCWLVSRFSAHLNQPNSFCTCALRQRQQSSDTTNVFMEFRIRARDSTWRFGFGPTTCRLCVDQVSSVGFVCIAWSSAHHQRVQRCTYIMNGVCI